MKTVVEAGPGAADALREAFAAAYGASPQEARQTRETIRFHFSRAIERVDRGEPGGVAALVRNPVDGSVLWLRHDPSRGWPANTWALPGGSVNPGEAFEDAVVREVLEETGLQVAVERPLILLRQTFTCGKQKLRDQPFVFFATRPTDPNPSPSPRPGEIEEVRWWRGPPPGAFDRDLVARALALWDS